MQLLGALVAVGLGGCVGPIVDLGEIRSIRPADAGCQAPLDPIHTLTSIADVRARISGRWVLCSGEIFSPTGAVGLEFDDLGAYFLVSHEFHRGAGFEFERTVEILDLGAMDGPGSFQLTLRDLDGRNVYRPLIAESGLALRLREQTSGKVAQYTRLP